MKEKIILALKSVFDPEIPVNIWDLGLVYDIQVKETGDWKLNTGILADDESLRPTSNHQSPIINHQFPVLIKLTMTSPTCPMSEEIIQMVKYAIAAVPGVGVVEVDLVWDPPWDISKMSAAARLELDLTEEGW
jgi:metal-sulfur cluster biosynthetic enzyme